MDYPGPNVVESVLKYNKGVSVWSVAGCVLLSYQHLPLPRLVLESKKEEGVTASTQLVVNERYSNTSAR